MTNNMQLIKRAKVTQEIGSLYLPKLATQLAEEGGDYLNAISMYSLYLSQYNDHRVLFNRAHCYLIVGKLEEALRDIDLVVGKKSDWHLALVKKGEILSEMERFEEAEHCFTEAQKLDRTPFLQDAIKWNIFFALRKCGFDEVKAGYGKDRFCTLSSAKKSLENGTFEETLDWIRSDKRAKAIEKWHNKKHLTPKNFY
ncbi:hypothetical protein HDE_10737 [Halotydeus destructor]|nr:hypothetical protein HDE_10737 [Halotydeus destructor]